MRDRRGCWRWLVVVMAAWVALPLAAFAQAPAVKTGQRVMDELLEFTVRRVEWHKTLSVGPLSATPHGEFLAIFLRAENAANVGSRSVTPETVTLVDARGRRLPRSPEAERVKTAMNPEEGSLFDKGKELFPSLRVDGWAVFDVPKDATGLKLVVKGVPSSPGKVIELGAR
jgi:uncharacterized protein DUF4352